MEKPFRPLVCDVMSPDCPARFLLALLADKWALLLVHALSEGSRRTGELRRRVGGVSEKMLVQTLRNLEAAGLVARRSFDEVPPRVEYSLTDRGWSLSPLVTALDRWVEANALDLPSGASDGSHEAPRTCERVAEGGGAVGERARPA